MRKIPGIPGDEDEHPANNSAAVDVSDVSSVKKDVNVDIHSNTIAMAISIISKW